MKKCFNPQQISSELTSDSKE